jgi:hypothetical protein
VHALEELERELGLGVLAPDTARDLDEPERVDLALDGRDELVKELDLGGSRAGQRDKLEQRDGQVVPQPGVSSSDME